MLFAPDGHAGNTCCNASALRDGRRQQGLAAEDITRMRLRPVLLPCLACAGFELTGPELADWMLRLQDEGRCHNINFVTPEHCAPQVKHCQWCCCLALRGPQTCYSATLLQGALGMLAELSPQGPESFQGQVCANCSGSFLLSVCGLQCSSAAAVNS